MMGDIGHCGDDENPAVVVANRLYDWDKVVRLTLEGRSAFDIAAIVGCSTRSVQRIRFKTGISRPPAPLMTPEEVAMAERMLDDGVSLGEIARTLGHRGGVYKRWKGRGWPSKDGAMARELFGGVQRV